MIRSTRLHPILSLILVAAGLAAAAAASSGVAPRGAPPLNERYIQVVDSQVVLRLWDEAASDGGQTRHYSISLDGQTYSRPRQTSYLIKLRYGFFDPAIGTPEVAPTLQAAGDSELYIVQFVTQPIEAMREALRTRGAVIRTFLANHAHIVTMTRDARDAIQRLPFVRWVGPLHVAYKLDEHILDQALEDEPVGPRRYSILLFERGEAAQSRVAARIDAVGSAVTHAEAAGRRLEAVMTLDQVLAIARLDDVLFIDPKGDLELDMDIARQIGGADYIETNLGFTGQGVRGEVADSGLFVDHPDFQARPPIIHTRNGSSTSHGTSVYGIVFGDGTGNPSARGMLPGAQGIFTDATPLRGGGPFRFAHTAELVDPFGRYRAVFQTNSTGDPRTFFYTTISAEMDDLLFAHDIIICQSQSNAGNQDSRPQAWAKNIVSGGGVQHLNTLDRSDDRWGGGGSTGPASDGRVKPTLTHFYDNILTTSSNGGYTTGFGGTSGATPIIAGHFGLMFQMWHEGVFEGLGGGPTVFDSRPHMSTAKALLVNTAFRYDWNVGGPNADLNRFRQGWGMPDLRELEEYADRIFIVNESDLLTELGSSRHIVNVAPGEDVLRVTMVYADPMGVPMSSQHRINDLSLHVTSPSGVEYWGNNGLTGGNESTPGGVPNVIDTVENVFVIRPEAGDWILEVLADEINEDSHVETPELDADYALVVTGARGPTRAFGFRVTEAPTGLVPDGTAARVEVLITPLAETIVPGSPTLFYRSNGGSFDSIAMSGLGGDLYGVDLPAVTCGDLPEYYIEAAGDGGTVLTSPPDVPWRTYAITVGEIRVVFSDNFETDRGWITRNLGATAGDFDRGVPVNDPNWPHDPISDSDGSGSCWLTENDFGDTDVDDGRVRLISPRLDMSQGEITISYDYFLRLDSTRRNDEILVEINDTTQPVNWIEIARHVVDGGLDWRTQTITDGQLRAAGVTLSSAVKVRFTVKDASPQSVVEAAIDAFKVTVRGCFPSFAPGDLNCDGDVNALDIEGFIVALFDPTQYPVQYPDCDINLADINGDGTIDALDIEEFINLLFGP